MFLCTSTFSPPTPSPRSALIDKPSKSTIVEQFVFSDALGVVDVKKPTLSEALNKVINEIDEDKDDISTETLAAELNRAWTKDIYRSDDLVELRRVVGLVEDKLIPMFCQGTWPKLRKVSAVMKQLLDARVVNATVFVDDRCLASFCDMLTADMSFVFLNVSTVL
jgi:hypothetical protein